MTINSVIVLLIPFWFSSNAAIYRGGINNLKTSAFYYRKFEPKYPRLTQLDSQC